MIKESKIKETVYMKGRPREYRFSADNGHFYTPRKAEDLGTSLSIVPIMVNAFNAPENFMGNESYSGRPFIQIYFLNEQGHVCTLMFHSASVRGFMDVIEDSFYNKLTLTFSLLTMTSEKVQNKDGLTYYKLKFTQEAIDAKASTQIQDLCGDLLDGELFSMRTAYIDMVDFSELNMSIPTDQQLLGEAEG